MSKRRALGQHFLTSKVIAESIAKFARIGTDDTVLEIGTGRGILTPYLYERAKKVITVEKDPGLYFEAKTKFSGVRNLVVKHGDAFGMDLSFDIFVSNLPYSESRNAIEWLAQRGFSHGVIMVQKEFAAKLLSCSGSGRRAVSVLANYCMDMKKLMDVRKASFDPVPKVDSVILGIEHKRTVSKEILTATNRLFSFKRKTVRTIGRKFGLVINLDKRLEELPDEEIVEFAKKIT